MYQKVYKVLSLYCGNLKRRLHLREISRLSRLPLRTTANNLGKLEKDNVIKGRIEGRHKYYKLNLDNIETKFWLIHSEIHRTLLFLQKYPVLKSFLKEIGPGDFAIIVFGSFAESTATEDSDLDLLIISDKKIELPFHLIPYKIHKINLSKKAFHLALSRDEPLMREILANHIILHNHSYFVGMAWWYFGKKS